MIKSQQGFTLIEMLIAVTIFVIVATVSVGSFVTSSRAIRKTKVIRDIHQPARVIFQQIAEDVRDSSGVVCMNDVDCESPAGSLPDDPRRVTNHIKLCLQAGGGREYYFDRDKSKVYSKDNAGTFNLVPDTTAVLPSFDGVLPGNKFFFRIIPSNPVAASDPCVATDPSTITLQPFVEISADFVHTNAATLPPEFRSSMSVRTLVSLREWTKIYSQ